jgi:hypothetical protein
MRWSSKVRHALGLALTGAMIVACDSAHKPEPVCSGDTVAAVRFHRSAPSVPHLAWCHVAGDTGESGRHGPFEHSFVEGLPAERSRWRNGQRHGPYQRWACNGQLLEEGGFHDGARHGCWRHWFRSGGLESTGCYEAGLRQGLWVNWHRNGTVHLVRWYRDDQRSGPSLSWTDQGTLHRTQER